MLYLTVYCNIYCNICCLIVGSNKRQKKKKTISSNTQQQGARWLSGLEHCTGDRVVLGSNPAAATSLRNFCNSIYPLLEETPPQCQGKIPPSALEMCNLSWTPPLLEKDNSKNNHVCNILKFESFTVSEGKERKQLGIGIPNMLLNILKQKCRKYPAIHTNYSCSN